MEREVSNPNHCLPSYIKFFTFSFLKKIVSLVCPKTLIIFIFGYAWFVNFEKVYDLICFLNFFSQTKTIVSL